VYLHFCIKEYQPSSLGNKIFLVNALDVVHCHSAVASNQKRLFYRSVFAPGLPDSKSLNARVYDKIHYGDKNYGQNTAKLKKQ